MFPCLSLLSMNLAIDVLALSITDWLSNIFFLKPLENILIVSDASMSFACDITDLIGSQFSKTVPTVY